MSWSCIRRLEFDYGHRLLNHESKCAHMHGHRGVVEIECIAAELDRAGRVIDFGKVKEVVGGWIDDHLDHAFIANRADEVMCTFLQAQNQRRFLFDGEPSAENLAVFIRQQAATLLMPYGIKVGMVRFWETPNGSAVAL